MSTVTSSAPAASSATAEAAKAKPRRSKKVERKPRFAIAVTVAFFFILSLPIFVVVLFSFNSKNSLSVFGGFSTRWYKEFVHDPTLTGAVGTSLEISAVAMVGSVILGTMLALGLVRARGKIGGMSNIVMLIPLVTPEIVTGVASQILFKGLGITPSLTTVMLAETTFSISYVTVILRSRVAALNPEVEEAAMDLGATRIQALRLVTLPALLPAIMASAVLIFAMIFDDFVLAYFTTGVTPQPISVVIYSAVRFGVRPSINALGTLMLVGSISLIGLAMFIPRLFGRKGGIDLLSGD